MEQVSRKDSTGLGPGEREGRSSPLTGGGEEKKEIQEGQEKKEKKEKEEEEEKK
jgi:hypothetical protein